MVQVVVHTSNGMQRWSNIEKQFSSSLFLILRGADVRESLCGKAKEDEPVISFHFTVRISIFVNWSIVQPLPLDAKLLSDMSICSTIWWKLLLAIPLKSFRSIFDCTWIVILSDFSDESSVSTGFLSWTVAPNCIFWGFCCTLCRTMLIISSRFTCMACSKSISRPPTFTSYSS